jgi:hypothetical protein
LENKLVSSPPKKNMIAKMRNLIKMECQIQEVSQIVKINIGEK